NIDPDTVNFASRSAKCPNCDVKYIIEQAQNFARVEVDKTKDIKNYRQNLSRAIDFNDAPVIMRNAQKILDILPDDYEANYFFAYGKAKHEDDDRLLYSFLDDDALDCTDEAQERVVMHLIKFGNIRDEKRIVQFIGRMGSASERYLNLYRQEFEKKAEEEELYDDITRDVFICHRSTDGEVANRIVRELERDGNKCWISSRNLRPNDNENYWDDIHRAVKSCRVFLVVSTRDAMISADVKKEIAFAKDLNKKRLEVKIDDSEHTALFKDFFDGYKWIKGEEYSEIKRRVADLLMQEMRKETMTGAQTQTEQPQTTVFRCPQCGHFGTGVLHYRQKRAFVECPVCDALIDIDLGFGDEQKTELHAAEADLWRKEFLRRSRTDFIQQNAVEEFNKKYSKAKKDAETQIISEPIAEPKKPSVVIRATNTPRQQSVVDEFDKRYSQAHTNKERIQIIRSFVIPSTSEDL
ncbi:MAG: toll/interleukin-1 receptor domain-containing protein, partial [Clostridia bacterium]|nr:toll/interleukin-1 receptor domain-containing protein [Clostridia bacterium]